MKKNIKGGSSMKGSIKKILASILIIALFITLMAGCTEKNADTTKETTKATTKATTVADTVATTEKEIDPYAPVEGKRYKITWVAYQVGIVDEDAALINYWNERFNVEIEVWNIENAKYDEILGLRMAGGEVPDKFNIRGMGPLNSYVEQGVLATVPMEVLKTYAPNVYNKSLELEPDVFKYVTKEGKLYGIPVLEPNNKWRQAAIFRGDWLKNVGIEKTPETIEEFEDAMYKFTLNDPDGNGENDTYGLSETGLPAVYGAFGYNPDRGSINNKSWVWTEKDGELVYGAIQPEMKEALKLLNKWYEDGVLDPEFITGENKGGYWALSHAFLESKIGYTGMGNWYHWSPDLTGRAAGQDYVELEKINKEAAESLVYAIPPKGPEGKMGITQGNYISGNVIGFGKQLENEPDKLAKILQILETTCTSYDDYLIAKYGIKGEHWDFDENGKPASIGIYTDSVERDKIGVNNIMTGIFGLISDPVTKYQIDFCLENNFDIGGMPNELMVTLPSEDKYKTELMKIQQEAYLAIITGDKPLDYFDEFVVNWKAAGGEQLEKEVHELN